MMDKEIKEAIDKLPTLSDASLEDLLGWASYCGGFNPKWDQSRPAYWLDACKAFLELQQRRLKDE